jgi:AhpD family alkylhydroperoxidase
MAGRALICGGSIGGLFAAAMLRRAGWEAVVLERSRTELSGRGAGIVTHDLLNGLIRAAGATTGDLGVSVTERVAFDRTGGRVATLALPQIVTSWDRVHSALRALVPDGAYRLGQSVTGSRQTAGGVALALDGGQAMEADLVVGADGFRSAVRGQMHPEVQPRYAGYVVWRALAHDPALLKATWERVQEVMAPGELDPLVKELIYVAVSTANGCSYCVHSHTAAARAKGMTPGMHAELLRVIALASQTNALAHAMQVETDERFKA